MKARGLGFGCLYRSIMARCRISVARCRECRSESCGDAVGDKDDLTRQ